jgi:outer membrane protein
MSSMKSWLLLAAAGLALLTLGYGLHADAAGPPPTKVGYIDLQRTLNETAAGKKAREKLEGEKKSKQDEIDKSQADLKKVKQQLDKDRAVMKPEVLRAREEELQDKVVKLQEHFVQYQQELAKKEAELTRDIFQQAAKIIESIAQRDGYTIMLEKNESAVLWADTHYDITAEVDQRLDNGGK